MKTSTAQRLKEIMSTTGLRQVDILAKCKPFCEAYNVKLGRNDLSQYISGKVIPGQQKLSILGMALDVNEAWLMGYDVKKERKELSTEEAERDFELLDKFSLLSDKDKQLVTDIIDSLINK